MKHSARIALLIAIASLFLGGCATNREVGLASGVEVADLTQLPAPSRISQFTIGRQQELEIIVADAEMLSGKFLTDGEGYIAYPLVGDLYLGGKTPNQAARMIAERLRGQYVVNPQVRVLPTEIPIPSISLGGQVNKPGTYPAATSQTLTRAINNAGGTADYAQTDDVLVMRTVDGQRYIGVYNLTAIQRGNYDDPTIFSDDIITVGDSASRRRLETILQFIPLLSTAIILLDRVGQ